METILKKEKNENVEFLEENLKFFEDLFYKYVSNFLGKSETYKEKLTNICKSLNFEKEFIKFAAENLPAIIFIYYIRKKGFNEKDLLEISEKTYGGKYKDFYAVMYLVEKYSKELKSSGKETIYRENVEILLDSNMFKEIANLFEK